MVSFQLDTISMLFTLEHFVIIQQCCLLTPVSLTFSPMQPSLSHLATTPPCPHLQLTLPLHLVVSVSSSPPMPSWTVPPPHHPLPTPWTCSTGHLRWETSRLQSMRVLMVRRGRLLSSDRVPLRQAWTLLATPELDRPAMLLRLRMTISDIIDSLCKVCV